jgi:hypothetical protein
MNYKKAVKLFFGIIITISMIVISLLYIYDPLHIYHKSWITEDTKFNGNIRLQAAGIINNYDFDSIILGTSMMKGTSEIEASEKIGGTFVNISADGSDLYERSPILEYTLRKKDIKNVIYTLDTGLDLNLRKGGSKFTLNQFDYLYDNNPFNDLKVYWNNKYLNCLLTFSKSPECIGSNKDMIRPKEWFNDIYLKNKEISGIDNWIKKGGRGKNVYSRVKKHTDKNETEFNYNEKLKNTQNIIDEKLMETIKKYPYTNFHIVFPPYSRFIYSLWKNYTPEKYKLYFETINYMYLKSKIYPNLKIYFIDNLDYINDLNNYRDMRHYNIDMNSMILDYIKEKKYLKSENEYKFLIKEAEQKTSEYDLESQLNQLEDSFKFRAKISRTIEKDSFIIKGWAFSYNVNKVELYIDNKKIKIVSLKKDMNNYKLYPQYNQKNNSFYFKVKKDYINSENIELYFKYKNRVIKKIKLRENEIEI